MMEGPNISPHGDIMTAASPAIMATFKAGRRARAWSGPSIPVSGRQRPSRALSRPLPFHLTGQKWVRRRFSANVQVAFLPL